MIGGDSTDFVPSQTAWLFVLQYPIVASILAIVQSITQARGTYCLEGNNAHFAHIWVSKFSVFLPMYLDLTLQIDQYLPDHIACHGNDKCPQGPRQPKISHARTQANAEAPRIQAYCWS